MGFLARRAARRWPAGEGLIRPVRPDDRYGTKPGPRPGGAPEPTPARRTNTDPVGLPDPSPAPRPDADPVMASEPAPAGRAGADLAGPPASRPGVRTDLTELLGRTVLEARVQRICREYGLIPRSGAAVGSGLSRSYLSREAGVELAADAHGVVTTVFLHFHGDDGFKSFQGEIPGGAGSVPRRAHLRETLGHPDWQRDPYRDRFLGYFGPCDRWDLAGFALHAQFAVDGERLERITLTPPERRPHPA